MWRRNQKAATVKKTLAFSVPMNKFIGMVDDCRRKFFAQTLSWEMVKKRIG
jgi:hypothetical protein